jgi:hypothetical protein
MSKKPETREGEISNIMANTKAMFAKNQPTVSQDDFDGSQPISFDQLEVCLKAAVDKLFGYDGSPNIENRCREDQTPYHPGMVRIYDTSVNFGAHVRGDFKGVPTHKPKI